MIYVYCKAEKCNYNCCNTKCFTLYLKIDSSLICALHYPVIKLIFLDMKLLLPLTAYFLFIDYNVVFKRNSALLTYNRQWVCCRTRRGGRITLQHEPIYVAHLQPRIFSRCQPVAFVKRQIVLRDVSSGENVMNYGFRVDIVRFNELACAYPYPDNYPNKLSR